VADQGSLVGGVGFEARAPSIAEVENSGLLEKDEGEEEQEMEDARFLYPAKAARGPCMRLA